MSVTIFLIIMIPVSGFLGFMTCAILQIAAQADRQEEKLFAAQLQKDAAEAQDHKEDDA